MMITLLICSLTYISAHSTDIEIPEKSVNRVRLPAAKCKFTVHSGGPDGIEISGTFDESAA